MSAADCDFKAWSGGTDVRGTPWGLSPRVVGRVWVAASGDGWERPVLSTVPSTVPSWRVGRSPASSTWHGVSEAR